ncbi:MarR family winged helix-turn-helix transcriptional regulator [Nocardia grenadensis]|uniref:MarR family winged helix-turn-helix transcriptional regulator n=1 Tax=Nocardia grenadensis TaxID=931537 RepID=UPI0014722901|nr:MarR family transcriptional regulator [Nocardia grenadensis]
MENATAMRTASLLHDSARELSRLLDRELATHGVTAQQAALLINLAGGESSPKRLAAVLGIDTGGATRLVDRLEAKGLLRRRPGVEDRRAVVLELTESGRGLTPVLAPTFAAVAASFFLGSTDAEIRGAGDLLERALTREAAGHSAG